MIPILLELKFIVYVALIYSPWIPDAVLQSARYYLKERRNAHGKVKPLKTLKNKKNDRESRMVNDRESRMTEEKVDKILNDHNERLLKKDLDSKP